MSQTIRKRFNLARQVKVTSAEARLSIYFLTALPIVFALPMYIMNPSYVGMLFTDPEGQELLFLALFLEVVGFVVMRIMTKVDA